MRRSLTTEVVTTVMTPREVDGDEPPALVAAALAAADVALPPVSYSISHSSAVREALAGGTRVLALPAMVSPEMLVRGGPEADFEAETSGPPSTRTIRPSSTVHTTGKVWASLGDAGVYNIAQLAIGLNPAILTLTGRWTDHGAFGTVHIGIGTSANLGGATRAVAHFDGTMFKPTLILDGTGVLEEGELRL